ncbi:MAG TPA: alpha-amylase, partial [bacterium]|nr:alpha-amylase [bacterium]
MTDKFIIKLKRFPFQEFNGEQSECPMFHFHINGNARKKYSFNRTILSTSGNVVFADFASAKEFAGKMNSYNRANGISGYVRPSDIYAMALIDEIFHFVIHSYRENKESGLLKRLYEKASGTIGRKKVSQTVKYFVSDFMPPSIEEGFESVDDYLKKSFNSATGEIIEFEEMITLKLANENPAFSQFRELFDDTDIDRSSSYGKIFSIVENYLEETTEITVGEKKVSLIELLRAPMKKYPDSLSDQLKYIVDEWGFEMLGDFSRKLLTAVDVIKEEENKGAAPGGSFNEVVTAETLSFPWGYDDVQESENFSTDSSWMPRVVMVAKNVFVWMDQLSKLYSREINTLDQIPDDELKIMAGRGFTALWLIGLWERSRASRKIKQLMGNPEA